jgi:hypothetical protein
LDLIAADQAEMIDLDELSKEKEHEDILATQKTAPGNDF